jgi:hypothetical protein
MEYLSIDIYRKPTITDIIPKDSCHPRGHKMAAIHYFHNRMSTYKLLSDSMQKENNTIQQILTNNKYDASILKKVKHKKKQKQYIERTKWAKFTYTGKETKFITKIFKNTNVKVTFTADNTKENHLTTSKKQSRNKYDKSGIYQLTCPSCNMKYIRQNGRPFKVCFQEHLCDFKYGNKKSRFTQHLLENQHSIDSMENIMDTVHITNSEDTISSVKQTVRLMINPQSNPT